MIKISLHWKILIAMLLGLIWALASENLNLVSFNILWISPFGDIFMKLLKLIAVPLVLFFQLLREFQICQVFLSWVKWEQKQFYYT